jgi:hypothetical protein
MRTSIHATSGATALIGVFLGAGAVVALPIFYGVLGFVFGALGAAIYNLAARLVGGIEIELAPRPPQPGAVL